MRNIPEANDAKELNEYIQNRNNRRRQMLNRMSQHQRTAYAEAFRLPSPPNRLLLMEQGDEAYIRGIALLKSHRHLLGDNGLLHHPTERDVTAEDVATIGLLFEAANFQSNPGLMRHHELTRDYASSIAEQLNEDGMLQMNPYACAGMGMLRNAGMSVGARGYHHKGLVTRDLCRELGIHDAYIDYLRPPSVDAGPLRRDRYDTVSEADLIQKLHERHEQIARELTWEQKVLEMAGLLAKVDSTGVLMTFERVINDIARRTRSSCEAYEQSVGAPTTHFAARYASATLSPDFEEQWIELYRQIVCELSDNGVDLNAMRTTIAARHGLRT